MKWFQILGMIPWGFLNLIAYIPLGLFWKNIWIVIGIIGVLFQFFCIILQVKD